MHYGTTLIRFEALVILTLESNELVSHPTRTAQRMGCCKSGVTPSQPTNAQWRGCGKSGVDRIAQINNLKSMNIEATVKIRTGFDVDLNEFVQSRSAIPHVADLDDSC